MKIAPGIYPDLSNEDYHADTAIGSTQIRKFLELPALYKHLQENPTIPTKAMEFGTLYHDLLLLPEKFHEQYTIAPDTIKTRAAKAWKELEEQTVWERKKLVMHKDYMTACEMQIAIKSCPLIYHIISNSIRECSFFAIDKKTGLLIKGRPDIWHEEHKHMFDLKTVGNLDFMFSRKYTRHAYDLGAHIQLAHHQNVLEIATGQKVKAVAHIIQATVPPYPARIFTFEDEGWLESGDALCREALDDMSRCRENNVWPAFNDEAISLNFPDWGGLELKEWSVA